MKNKIQKIKIYGIKQSIIFLYSETILTWWRKFILKSYSQNGEDLVLAKLISKKKGFYVDIGAYDPTRYSNTKKFYDKGWRGINIEPEITKISKFQKYRKRDINLNVGVGVLKRKMVFYEFMPDTLSTFSKKEYLRYKKLGYKFIGSKKVEVLPLKEILSKRKSKKIDFLSVDTEGFDLEVLKSNDWTKFRPNYICIESRIHEKTNSSTRNKLLLNYLKKISYKCVYDNGLNSIYEDSRK